MKSGSGKSIQRAAYIFIAVVLGVLAFMLGGAMLVLWLIVKALQPESGNGG